MGILVNESQIGGGSSNSSHNIGDIFYTTRTDNSLNGAVECNGSQYNFSDFDSNLQTLFDEGKLPYVSIGEFDSMVSEKGWCDKIGYGTPKMVKIYPCSNVSEPPFVYIELTDEEYSLIIDTMRNCNINDILLYRLYDINTKELLENCYLKCVDQIKGFEVYNIKTESFEDITGFYELGMVYIPNDPVTIPDPDTSQASPTTYFKVPKLSAYIIQKENIPVIGNGITLGLTNGDNPDGGAGIEAGTFNLQKFQNQLGSNIGTALTGAGNLSGGRTFGVVTDPTKSGMISDLSNDSFTGRVMIQLFNSTTDTAVATCNQVLADVSALNGQDSVIYWDSYEASDHSHAYSNITLTEHQWYRIYKSGWVEQGGIILNAGVNQHIITIPIEMNNVEELKKGTTVYPIFISGTIQSQGVTVRNNTDSDWSSNTIDCFSWGATIHIKWEVKGYMLSTQS